MFTGIILLPIIISLLIPIVAIYLFATKRIKLASMLFSVIVLLPIVVLVLFQIEKKITKQDLQLVAANIPTYNKTVVTSNYVQKPMFSFFNDSFQQEGITLQIKTSGDINREEIVTFYDTWFKENGWTKTVSDVLTGQHHYIKGNTSAHLWLRNFSFWTIEITKR